MNKETIEIFKDLIGITDELQLIKNEDIEDWEEVDPWQLLCK